MLRFILRISASYVHFLKNLIQGVKVIPCLKMQNVMWCKPVMSILLSQRCSMAPMAKTPKGIWNGIFSEKVKM